MPNSCGESVLADDGLVVLHRKRRDGRDEARGARDHRGVDVRPERHHVVARLDRHHDLFQRRVARPLAKPIDGAFDLACARLHAGEAVGDGQPQIVMAVGGKDHPLCAGHALAQHGDDVYEFIRHRVAHRVGDVDGGRAGLDRGLHDAAQIVGFGPRRVHGRPFDIVDEIARAGDGGGHRLVNLIGVHIELVLPVQRRGSDEGVDAAALRIADGFAGAVDVVGMGAGEAGDHGVPGAPGDFRDRLEIADGRGGKAGLDDIDAHLVENFGNLHLLFEVHGCAGTLLAVAQRRVENQHAVFLGAFCGGIRLRPSKKEIQSLFEGPCLIC